MRTCLIFLKLLLAELFVARFYGLNKEFVTLWRENKMIALRQIMHVEPQ